MAHLPAYEIELFATNTGSLYEGNKALGRRNADVSEWASRITQIVLPAYRMEISRAASIPSRTLWAAAEALRAHYVEHVAEIARCEAAA